MRVKVGTGLATIAALLALFVASGGNLTPPVPTPTPTPVPGECLAAANCFPKPPGGGDGAAGIPPGTVLHACGGTETIETDDLVIDGCTYTGSLQINADDVTIRNSRIHGSVATGGLRLLVEDSEIGPDVDEEGCGELVALIRWSNYTALRNYLHGNGDGFRAAGNDILIRDNFVETCDKPLDHSDGVQGNFSGQNNVVDHNTIDLRGSLNGPNAPVFYADDSQSATITDNLLINSVAGVFALKVNDDHNPDVGPWVVTGNLLIPPNVVTTNTQCGAGTMTWNNNRGATVNSDYTIAAIGNLVSC